MGYFGAVWRTLNDSRRSGDSSLIGLWVVSFAHADLEWALAEAGAVKTDMEENPRGEQRHAGDFEVRLRA